MPKMSLSHFSIFVNLKHNSRELKALLFSNEKKVYCTYDCTHAIKLEIFREKGICITD